jgi:hypothetical protein
MENVMKSSTVQWIVSLAVSVVLCAVLFVIYALMLLDSQKAMVAQSVHIEVLEDRLVQTTGHIDVLRAEVRLLQNENQIVQEKLMNMPYMRGAAPSEGVTGETSLGNNLGPADLPTFNSGGTSVQEMLNSNKLKPAFSSEDFNIELPPVSP